MTNETARRGLAAVVVALASVGPALAAETSTTAFLSQDEVALPERSRAIDPLETVAGCGAVTAGRFTVDGDPSDWTGEPTWIAGTGRYDGGEYIWTDYPFDDDGTGSYQYPGEGEALSGPAGTLGKATSRQQRFGSNAADVVELRAAVDDDFLYFLVRLNFLNAIDSTVVGLGLDLDENPATGFSDWPRAAKMSTPGMDLFVTAWGACASVKTAAGEQSIADLGGAIRVDTRANVFEIAVPKSLLNGASSFRMVGGSGIWNPATSEWMAVQAIPRTEQNTSELPRGAKREQDPSVFNLLFRDDELTTEACAGQTDADPDCLLGSPRTFQTRRQHQVLSANTTGPYAVTLDLGRLVAGATSDPPLVRRGAERHFTRVYRSRIEAEGVFTSGRNAIFMSRYQPYSVYVPGCYETGCAGLWPGGRPPLAVILHGGGGSHVSNPPNPSLPDSVLEGSSQGDLYGVERVYEGLETAIAPIIVSPLGRGQRPPWWRGPGEADVLEVRENASLVYGTDPERQVLTGASLGGYGTFRLGSLYPDAWGGVFAHCPATHEDSFSARYMGNVDPSTQPFVVDPLIPSLLNLPMSHAAGTIDPLTPINTNRRLRDAVLAASLEYRYTEYTLGSHCFDVGALTQPWIEYNLPEAVRLLSTPRVHEPARVRYRIDPRHYPAAPEPLGVFDIRDLGIAYRGAYWVSGLVQRPGVEALGASGAAPGGTDESVLGVIDVASHARPGWQVGAESCGESFGLGDGNGGNPELAPRWPTPHFYECQHQTRSGATEAVIDLAVRNLDAATLDLAGAGINGGEAFTVMAVGDGALSLTLAGVTASAVAGPCVNGFASGVDSTAIDLSLSATACTITVTP